MRAQEELQEQAAKAAAADKAAAEKAKAEKAAAGKAAAEKAAAEKAKAEKVAAATSPQSPAAVPKSGFLADVEMIRQSLGISGDLPAPVVLSEANSMMGVAASGGALPQQATALIKALGLLDVSDPASGSPSAPRAISYDAFISHATKDDSLDVFKGVQTFLAAKGKTILPGKALSEL